MRSLEAGVEFLSVADIVIYLQALCLALSL